MKIDLCSIQDFQKAMDVLLM